MINTWHSFALFIANKTWKLVVMFRAVGCLCDQFIESATMWSFPGFQETSYVVYQLLCPLGFTNWQEAPGFCHNCNPLFYKGCWLLSRQSNLPGFHHFKMDVRESSDDTVTTHISLFSKQALTKFSNSSPISIRVVFYEGDYNLNLMDPVLYFSRGQMPLCWKLPDPC